MAALPVWTRPQAGESSYVKTTPCMLAALTLSSPVSVKRRTKYFSHPLEAWLKVDVEEAWHESQSDQSSSYHHEVP